MTIPQQYMATAQVNVVILTNPFYFIFIMVNLFMVHAVCLFVCFYSCIFWSLYIHRLACMWDFFCGNEQDILNLMYEQRATTVRARGVHGCCCCRTKHITMYVFVASSRSVNFFFSYGLICIFSITHTHTTWTQQAKNTFSFSHKMHFIKEACSISYIATCIACIQNSLT